ncbi:MAG: hypothetical protein UU37_C0004G0016 [Candidatus Gottesmanbacteria bacterium GW2011_GWA2_41_12]|nr:MAG: hypothetical protein UU37_C0004G0016 [Candidatus Gottesmanbacteria bacterium GW2011_GWA2_41_12]
MLQSVLSEVSGLKPKLIRIDHIYDMYDVVTKDENSISMNFSKLDSFVEAIRSTGASPFFSISYMPTALSSGGDVTSQPLDWNDWETVVKETIEHYSGKSGMNLNNIYYEIWNEPDLFGNWKIGGDKDYRLLYHHSVNGASKALGTNQFFIGGPATTSPYSNWFNGLLQYVSDNNIRLDFLSWHRYSTDTQKYSDDIKILEASLDNFPGFKSIPLFITEWGIDSENNPYYDNKVSAAHTVSVIRTLLNKIDFAFSFELKDGPSPKGEKYWGRWGILTHEKTGVEKKPRYRAFELLNKMSGTQIGLMGEGTWVTGFAAKEGNTTRVILSNYDIDNVHTESTPIVVGNLDPGNYEIKTYRLDGNVNEIKQYVGANYFTNLILLPNEVVVLELTNLESVSVKPAELDIPSAIPSVNIDSTPLFSFGTEGSMEMEFKPVWESSDLKDKVLFQSSITHKTGNLLASFGFSRKKLGFGNSYIFGIFDGEKSNTINFGSDWIKIGQWQKFTFIWNSEGYQVKINDKITATKDIPLDLSDLKITFSPENISVKNMKITSGNEIIWEK